MEFEWDNQKARDNFRRHGIAFEDAAWLFRDENRLEVSDDRFAYDEARFFTIGAAGPHILYVAYTLRDDRIRIISARKATRRERKHYETLYS